MVTAKRLTLGLLLAGLIALTSHASQEATPILTDTQRAMLENVQLRVALAERDLVILRYQQNEYIASLQRAGWVLDLRTQTYSKPE